MKEAQSNVDVDLDRLAYAVAMSETGDCTKGIGPRTMNCFGIMTWERGYREPKIYKTKEESYEDFKRIWKKGYGGRMPGVDEAIVWTGNDSPTTWLDSVYYYY